MRKAKKRLKAGKKIQCKIPDPGIMTLKRHSLCLSKKEVTGTLGALMHTHLSVENTK